jgi:hypothetical protein
MKWFEHVTSDEIIQWVRWAHVRWHHSISSHKCQSLNQLRSDEIIEPVRTTWNRSANSMNSYQMTSIIQSQFRWMSDMLKQVDQLSHETLSSWKIVESQIHLKNSTTYEHKSIEMLRSYLDLTFLFRRSSDDIWRREFRHETVLCSDMSLVPHTETIDKCSLAILPNCQGKHPLNALPPHTIAIALSHVSRCWWSKVFHREKIILSSAVKTHCSNIFSFHLCLPHCDWYRCSMSPLNHEKDRSRHWDIV